MAQAAYVADKRLYLNKEGEVVDAASPDRVELLVAEGGTLPHDVAVSHGLIQGDRDTQTEPAPLQGDSRAVRLTPQEYADMVDAIQNGDKVAEALHADNKLLKEQVAGLEPLATENEQLNRQMDDLKNGHSAALDKAGDDLANALAENKKLTARITELEKPKAVKPGDNKAITEAPETK